ncbi:MAG: hypothetical protein EXR55_03810 [Dehalococcoidia bacterium]|nr:hypothetical protein [Dehalococcoidia bacterium]
MPTFMDHHKLTSPTPPAMLKLIADGIKARKADPKTKIKPLSYIESKTDANCITESPNAQASHAHHEGQGIKLGAGDVTEVKTAV